MTDPLGRSQVLPYLGGSRRGAPDHVRQLRKAGALRPMAMSVRANLRAGGHRMAAARYHKRPPILSWHVDVLRSSARQRELQRVERFDLVHCRSYMAAIAGDWLKRRYGVPFLFDMRGFWADERVERGIWPARQSAVPRWHIAISSGWRTRFFRDADAIVSLTDNPGAKSKAGPPIAGRRADHRHPVLRRPRPLRGPIGGTARGDAQATRHRRAIRRSCFTSAPSAAPI